MQVFNKDKTRNYKHKLTVKLSSSLSIVTLFVELSPEPIIFCYLFTLNAPRIFNSKLLRWLWCGAEQNILSLK